MTQSDDRLSLFVSVGLPEQRAKETLKNGALTIELTAVISDAQKLAGQHSSPRMKFIDRTGR